MGCRSLCLVAILGLGCAAPIEPATDASVRVWGPNQTCPLVAEHVRSCDTECPFLGGTLCDPEQALFCLYLLETGDDACAILAGPECVEACP